MEIYLSCISTSVAVTQHPIYALGLMRQEDTGIQDINTGFGVWMCMIIILMSLEP